MKTTKFIEKKTKTLAYGHRVGDKVKSRRLLKSCSKMLSTMLPLVSKDIPFSACEKAIFYKAEYFLTQVQLSLKYELNSYWET